MNVRNAQMIAAVRTARQKLTTAWMLTVNISSNYKRPSRSLDTLGRKQLPFAFAKALSETMKAVEKYTGVIHRICASWLIYGNRYGIMLSRP